MTGRLTASACALAFFALVALVTGCAASAPPDPRDAAKAYAAAAAGGDADALFEMLSEEDQRSLSREGVRTIAARDQKELRDFAAAVSDERARATAVATLRFKDGEQASLVLEDGHFRVTSAGTMPGGARSPEEALDQLRRALSRRSYPALLRVLSPATRAAVERDLRGLLAVLEKAGSLSVVQSGDTATVQVPGGHRVKLRREGTLWSVEDFD